MVPTRLDDAVLGELAETYGTPLYVYDLREVRRSVGELRDALPEGVRLCYAAKANTFVLREMASLVERVEVCSPGEYRICRRLGVAGGKLVVSGVHKDEPTVAAAVGPDGGGAVVTIESESQLALVDRLARERGTRVRALLRVSSGNQFGMDAELVARIVSSHVRDAGRYGVRPVGIQYFSGTQKVLARRMRTEVRRLDDFVGRLRDSCGWEAEEVEYGPGLPVAYFDPESLDDAALLGELSQALSDMRFSGRVTLEVGRRLAASCGTYLTRVVDAKVTRGQRYAIVDGGMNQLAYYGQSMAMRRPPCRLLGAPDEAPLDWNVCGSLCTVNDIIAKQLPLAGLREGSVIAFERAGAYCATEGMALFLSRDLPRVVFLDDDGPRLVRDAVAVDPLNAPPLEGAPGL